jgi:general stress protein YciG
MDKSDWTPESTSNTTNASAPPQGAPSRSRRGFAVMDGSLQRAISSKGGKAAHAKGRAHEFTADEAREAGRKGGHSVSKDREHMARIGREGGKARGRAQREKKEKAAAAE